MTSTTQDSLILGYQIQIDRSGVGHNWKNQDARDIPANIAEEIAAEINESNKGCEKYVASNGLCYRW